MSPHFCFEKAELKNMRGFTLIEIMVSISMLAVVMLSIYGVFSAVSLTKQRLDDDSAGFHLARVVFDRLGREIHGVYFRPDDDTTVFQSGLNQEGETFLQMTTTAVTPLSRKGTGVARVEYLLKEGTGSAADLVLLRAERQRQFPEDDENESMMRLATGIETMALRFFGRGQWHTDWDAAANGLPELVEVRLTLAGGRERRTPFMTTFQLPEVVLK